MTSTNINISPVRAYLGTALNLLKTSFAPAWLALGVRVRGSSSWPSSLSDLSGLAARMAGLARSWRRLCSALRPCTPLRPPPNRKPYLWTKWSVAEGESQTPARPLLRAETPVTIRITAITSLIIMEELLIIRWLRALRRAEIRSSYHLLGPGQFRSWYKSLCCGDIILSVVSGPRINTQVEHEVCYLREH